MLNKLLKILNLPCNQYFTKYSLLDNFLTIETSQSFKEETIIEEAGRIKEKINKFVYDCAYDNNVFSVSVKTIFKQITQEVYEELKKQDMVFPNQYNEKFIELATKQDEDFDIVDLICEDMIENIVTKHILKLDTCANDALEAMIAHDEKKLSNVIEETAVLREEIRSLKKTVYEDTLTSVYNRKWLDDQYLNRSHASHGSFVKDGVLAIIDLNDFKFINDNFGHIAGDKVLVFFAKKLKKLGGDVIRYGGDEFLILFDKESSIEKTKDDLHILREVIYKKNVEENGCKFKLSFSYGLATFRVNQHLTKVLGEADSAMYVDKEKFKSRIK